VSRRTLTQLLAVLLALGLAIVAGMRTVPYVVLLPGPAFDTLGDAGSTPVLSISGHKTYPTDGSLDLTTVSVLDGVSLAEALRAWWSSSEAVVPREVIYPPEQNREETEARNAEEMTQSHDDATTAALRAVGIKGTETVEVTAVSAGMPAEGLLEKGDVLVSVDGKKVADQDVLRSLINRKAPGATVVIGFLRKGKPGLVGIVTAAAKDDPKRAVVGVTTQFFARFPVKVDIQLKDVGGPSAGLMFALGIVDKLQPGSLTGGKHIAGTGEISPAGVVGGIGGIAQKMRGAQAAGATVFLVPDVNCAEARAAAPSRLQLVRVATLQGALSALSTLRSGGAPPTC
jgi:PDZ domain-containing protein